jgi:hypothetical protein
MITSYDTLFFSGFFCYNNIRQEINEQLFGISEQLETPISKVHITKPRRTESMSEKTWQDELNDKRRIKNSDGCTVPDGWKDLVLKTDRMLAHIDPDYTLNQAKSKFGALRYSYQTTKTGIDVEIMNTIITNSESFSHRVCEKCGFNEARLRGDTWKDRLRGSTWVETLCDTCNSSTNKKISY